MKELLGWTALGIFALIGFITAIGWILDAYDKFVPVESRIYLVYGFFAVLVLILIGDWVKRRFSARS
ncbi:MAG: hypothetical protein ACHQNE_07365 [Candidatus Kapaibacterium sp.]